MQHGQLLRLTFHDGLTEVGAYNSFSSSQHWLALAGFARRFYYDDIVDIFAKQLMKWTRVKGAPNIYDEYISTGGQLTQKQFFQVLHSDDV